MNLFYPFVFQPPLTSLSLGNSTRCNHHTDSLSTNSFFSISHFVYTLLYVGVPIRSPSTIFLSLELFWVLFLYHFPNAVHNPPQRHGFMIFMLWSSLHLQTGRDC